MSIKKIFFMLISVFVIGFTNADSSMSLEMKLNKVMDKFFVSNSQYSSENDKIHFLWKLRSKLRELLPTENDAKKNYTNKVLDILTEYSINLYDTGFHSTEMNIGKNEKVYKISFSMPNYWSGKSYILDIPSPVFYCPNTEDDLHQGTSFLNFSILSDDELEEKTKQMKAQGITNSYKKMYSQSGYNIVYIAYDIENGFTGTDFERCSDIAYSFPKLVESFKVDKAGELKIAYIDDIYKKDGKMYLKLDIAQFYDGSDADEIFEKENPQACKEYKESHETSFCEPSGGYYIKRSGNSKEYLVDLSGSIGFLDNFYKFGQAQYRNTDAIGEDKLSDWIGDTSKEEYKKPFFIIEMIDGRVTDILWAKDVEGTNSANF